MPLFLNPCNPCCKNNQDNTWYCVQPNPPILCPPNVSVASLAGVTTNEAAVDNIYNPNPTACQLQCCELIVPHVFNFDTSHGSLTPNCMYFTDPVYQCNGYVSMSSRFGYQPPGNIVFFSVLVVFGGSFVEVNYQASRADSQKWIEQLPCPDPVKLNLVSVTAPTGEPFAQLCLNWPASVVATATCVPPVTQPIQCVLLAELFAIEGYSIGSTVAWGDNLGVIVGGPYFKAGCCGCSNIPSKNLTLTIQQQVWPLTTAGQVQTVGAQTVLTKLSNGFSGTVDYWTDYKIKNALQINVYCQSQTTCDCGGTNYCADLSIPGWPLGWVYFSFAGPGSQFPAGATNSITKFSCVWEGPILNGFQLWLVGQCSTSTGFQIGYLDAANNFVVVADVGLITSGFAWIYDPSNPTTIVGSITAGANGSLCNGDPNVPTFGQGAYRLAVTSQTGQLMLNTVLESTGYNDPPFVTSPQCGTAGQTFLSVGRQNFDPKAFSSVWPGWTSIVRDSCYFQDPTAADIAPFGYSVSIPAYYYGTDLGTYGYIFKCLTQNYLLFDTYPAGRTGYTLTPNSSTFYGYFGVCQIGTGTDPGDGMPGVVYSMVSITLNTGSDLTISSYSLWARSQTVVPEVTLKYTAADWKPLAVSRFVFDSIVIAPNNFGIGTLQEVFGLSKTSPSPPNYVQIPSDHELYVTAACPFFCNTGVAVGLVDQTCVPCYGKIPPVLNSIMESAGPYNGTSFTLTRTIADQLGSTWTGGIWLNSLAANPSITLYCNGGMPINLAVSIINTMTNLGWGREPTFSISWTCTPGFYLTAGPFVDPNGNDVTIHIFAP